MYKYHNDVTRVIDSHSHSNNSGSSLSTRTNICTSHPFPVFPRYYRRPFVFGQFDSPVDRRSHRDRRRPFLCNHATTSNHLKRTRQLLQRIFLRSVYLLPSEQVPLCIRSRLKLFYEHLFMGPGGCTAPFFRWFLQHGLQIEPRAPLRTNQ